MSRRGKTRVQFNEKMGSTSEGFVFSNSSSHQEDLTLGTVIRVKGEIFLKKELHETGDVEDVLLGKNIVTLGASILLARLMKSNTDPAYGLFALAIGSGDPSWDPRNPPAPLNSRAVLVSEIARKQFSATTFIQPVPAGSTPYPTLTPTNILDLTTVYGPGDAEGYWMEMGLVGGDASLAANSGTLVTYKTFGMVTKPAGSTYTVTYRLTF